jgi:hypothetical protein
MARHTHGYILLWLVVSWSLVTAAAWLIIHRERVRLLRTVLPDGVACSIVRQPSTIWVLLDSLRPEAARAELSALLSSWPTERTGEDLSPLGGLAALPAKVWGAPGATVV